MYIYLYTHTHAHVCVFCYIYLRSRSKIHTVKLKYGRSSGSLIRAPGRALALKAGVAWKWGAAHLRQRVPHSGGGGRRGLVVVEVGLK